MEEVIIQNITAYTIEDRKSLLEDINQINKIMSKWIDVEIVIKNVRLKRKSR